MIRQSSRGDKAHDQAARGTTSDAALKFLARRPLTRQELESRLSDRGYPRDEIREVIDRLGASGYLDDRSLALDYLVTRAQRLGHGRTRLLEGLQRRGVSRRDAEEAWNRAVSDGDIDPDLLLRRRALKEINRQGGAIDARGYQRVYNALLRAGFDPDAVEARLERYRAPGKWIQESERMQDDEVQ